MNVELDVSELAVRLCEANYGLQRPVPNARDALDAMEPEVRAAWLRSAVAAAEYLVETINAARAGN